MLEVQHRLIAMDLQYRAVYSHDEMLEIVRLPASVWGTLDRETELYYLWLAIQHAGGLVLGAFDEKRPIGMLLGFLGIRDDQTLHWSHMTGVLPEYQGRGIGTKLKLLQRQLVLEQGYDCIGWTYDPLQSGNAAFNIGRLGCICNLYHEDFYGNMADSINVGLPSDRFEVRWWLKSDAVLARIPQKHQAHFTNPVTAGIHQTLSMQLDGGPSDIQWPHGKQDVTLVEIPSSINDLKTTAPEKAFAWRSQTRRVFGTLFQAGYVVVDFLMVTTNITRFWYVLKK